MADNIVRHNWNGSEVRQRGDRYMCLTDMASALNFKKILSYHRTKTGKQYLSIASQNKGVSAEDLYEVSRFGTWVSPCVFLDAIRMLPFPLQWDVEDWYYALHGFTPDQVHAHVFKKLQECEWMPTIESSNNHDNPVWEKDYSDMLAIKLDGDREVVVPNGRIDIVTKDEIIEVKDKKNWLQAVEQINRYHVYFPLKQKRIHLLGKSKKWGDEYITCYCESLGILVTFEP